MKTKIFSIAFIFLPLINASAIVDDNSNGLSDVWEKNFNNNCLFPASFDVAADPDQDGWSNAQEAAAGTDPHSSIQPAGLLVPATKYISATWGDTDNDTIPDLITPEVIQVSWQTNKGKKYRLEANPGLSFDDWLPVDLGFVGNGSIVIYNFIPSSAARHFWRVSVSESGIDSDSDGLIDSEEAVFGSDLYSFDSDKDSVSDAHEFNLNTSPVSADTDGDGVSDSDEIKNNQLNPVLASDLDADEIPDDFEVHFSQQLLNSNPNPTHWGVLYGDLISGNLDSAHDYTDEGVSAIEIFQILAQGLAQNGNSTGYWIEPMSKSNKFSYAYNITNPYVIAEGLYRESKPGDFDTIETINDPTSFTGGYLSARIQNVDWAYSLTPYKSEFDPYLFRHFSLSSAGNKTIPLIDGTGTFFQGHIERKKFRLVATRPDHEQFLMDCVKVTDETEFWNGKFVANVTSESLILSVPKGKMFSNWIETVAPMGTGKDYSQYVVPCDNIIVFGVGSGGFVADRHITSKEYLETFLDTVKVSRSGDNWVVRGKSDLLYGIKIAQDESTLLQALSTPATTVVFDGHANFGIGPNFSLSTHKTINSFTNFGTENVTAIPVTYRGNGTEADALSEFLNQVPKTPGNAVAVSNIGAQGWAYLVLSPDEVMDQVSNFQIPYMNQRWKFESDYGVSAGASFTKGGIGLSEYHYIDNEDIPRLIISSPKSDVPILMYKTFFYNACSTGPHFINNFKHGNYVYTNKVCNVFKATQIFVQCQINREPIQICLDEMEDQEADGDDSKTYEYESF